MFDSIGFDRYLREAEAEGQLICQRNLPLSSCCTFAIGGPADYGLFPCTEQAFLSLMQTLKQYGVPYGVFGNGSNLLFDDAGLRGAAVFTTRLTDSVIEGPVIRASCGCPITSLAFAAQKQGLSGLEFAYGIPGSCGGAVYMNAGAYGGEIKNVVSESTAWDPRTDSLFTRRGEAQGFGYRTSSYMGTDAVILSARFVLQKADPKEIKAKMDGFMQCRRDKQPLEYPSAGSVFKRCEGHFSGQMIEECGLKGFAVGDAQVSEKHAGFIINRGHATSRDVLTLIEIIRSKVAKQFGVDLECEVQYIPPTAPVPYP